MTGIEQWFGWFVLAILLGIAVWGLVSLQATLMASAQSGASAEAMLLAVGGTDTEDDDLDDPEVVTVAQPADCDDYTYPLGAERLYDTRTYPERVDERLASIERRIAALEKLIDGRM